jgi:excinuclease ABC subunit C
MEPTMREVVARLPSTPGVYRFRDARGLPLYIGRASDLRHRVASYWSDLGDRAHLVRMVPQIVRIEAVACDSPHEAAWLERNLLERSMPRWNRVRGGMEVPVWVCMDARVRAPGLSVVHLVEARPGCRHFGPYLGGTRVRQAVAALERILPLAYAATGLRGSERAMARQRGVTDADHGWIVSALTAVLERNRDAVQRARGALEELRDRATAALAFERAGQIQAEWDALEWITSPQRVTLASGEDVDACGWADGVLVHYAIRDGRLSQWSQRATSEAYARPRVEATPIAWAEFTRRNAELAAALVPAPS